MEKIRIASDEHRNSEQTRSGQHLEFRKMVVSVDNQRIGSKFANACRGQGIEQPKKMARSRLFR